MTTYQCPACKGRNTEALEKTPDQRPDFALDDCENTVCLVVECHDCETIFENKYSLCDQVVQG